LPTVECLRDLEATVIEQESRIETKLLVGEDFIHKSAVASKLTKKHLEKKLSRDRLMRVQSRDDSAAKKCVNEDAPKLRRGDWAVVVFETDKGPIWKLANVSCLYLKGTKPISYFYLDWHGGDAANSTALSLFYEQDRAMPTQFHVQEKLTPVAYVIKDSMIMLVEPTQVGKHVTLSPDQLVQIDLAFAHWRRRGEEGWTPAWDRHPQV